MSRGQKTRNFIPVVFVVFVLLLNPRTSFAAPATDAPVKWPGRQPDGAVLLHNQWSIRPAGRQVELGSFPVNVAVHPKGKFAAVLHSGYGTNEVVVVDLVGAKVVARAALNNAFYGLVFSAGGRELFCGGGADEVVHRFDFRDGILSGEHSIKVHDPTLRTVPSGLALNRKGDRLFVANVWGNCVSEVEMGAETRTTDFDVGRKPSHLVMAPVVPPEDFDTASAEKRSEISLYDADPDDGFPYACCLDEKRQRLYVSLWAQAAVHVVDLKSRQPLSDWPAEEHPCEMVLDRSGRALYVANANRNTVTVFDTATGQPQETISAAFHPDDPPGSTPNSLALSPDQKTLYIANAGVNAIAVFDVTLPRKSRSLGFIPTGWYPTSVRITPDGKRLLVASGKGVATRPNPGGPQPLKKTADYIGVLYRGALSIIDLPRGDLFDKQMAAWTAEVFRGIPSRSVESPASNPIPARLGDTCPIKYCIYIIKENRTYDQILGDMPQGNGDAKLCLFPERATPNHHQLARQFVLLDNFYADAEVSADGHEWSMGAYASDFVQKMWPMEYGHNRRNKFPYPSEGYFPIAAPANGYLWDRARQAGISYRSYGEFVSYDQKANEPARARVKALQGHIDPFFRGFDLHYSDAKRADRFIAEFKRLEAADEMPRLQIMRLPNDHTHGASVHFPTPSAYIADNDLALGRVVEMVSHSKYWPQTAIFVVEDDAQNGPDHVDSHRTIAFVISPYVRHGTTDSTLYSTTSMLRTMELILGLKPMTQFDTAAAAMYRSFQAAPDLRPYDAVPENINMEEKNERTAWGAGLKMNFAREDAADEFLLNEAVWKSVRGAASPLPAPVHAAFVFSAKEDDGD